MVELHGKSKYWLHTACLPVSIRRRLCSDEEVEEADEEEKCVREILGAEPL